MGHGFDSETSARDFATLVSTYIQVLGCTLNLTDLESVTIATEEHYTRALLELDRGFDTRSTLTPTKENYAVGVAMTPTVLRHGAAKSVMFFRTEALLPLSDSKHASYNQAFHLLYHECAHVEVTTMLNRAFPRFMLTPTDDFIRSQRWAQVLTCWDEFAVCDLSANVGDKECVLSGYADTFCKALQSTRETIEDRIKSYRLHGDHERVARDVFALCGSLAKFSAYMLGTLRGQGRSWTDLADVQRVVSGSWFKPYLIRLDSSLNKLMDSYGKWASLNEFEALGDLIEEIVGENGLFLTNIADGGAYVRVPF